MWSFPTSTDQFPSRHFALGYLPCCMPVRVVRLPPERVLGSDFAVQVSSNPLSWGLQKKQENSVHILALVSFSLLSVELFIAWKDWAQGGARSSQLLGFFSLWPVASSFLSLWRGFSGWRNMLCSKGLWRTQKLVKFVWTQSLISGKVHITFHFYSDVSVPFHTALCYQCTNRGADRGKAGRSFSQCHLLCQ